MLVSYVTSISKSVLEAQLTQVALRRGLAGQKEMSHVTA